MSATLTTTPVNNSARFMIPSRIADDMWAKIAEGETGGTYSVDGHALPEHGFYVGGVVPSLINPTKAQLTEFIELAGADYVGFWVDDNDGEVYVDAVDWTPSKAAADRLADVRGEIAYWDIARKQETRVRHAYEGYNR